MVEERIYLVETIDHHWDILLRYGIVLSPYFCAQSIDPKCGEYSNRVAT